MMQRHKLESLLAIIRTSTTCLLEAVVSEIVQVEKTFSKNESKIRYYL